MPKLTIDDQEIEVAPGTSILQAAEQLGVEVPRFCYHDRLSVPANCRMCLVELEGAPKPVASCAMACGDNMIVRTKSDKVKKARKGVMEMMLINHPLDCPICDQGGECDLQDQAVAYGFDRSRYDENKRAVPDKNLGPLIKTSMNRCINCTRCVRFGEEIAGVTELGQLNRGENAEIGTFIQKAISTELSGNMIDVCPVGALTNKPYAFRARPWELRKTESVDVHDALGVNIRVDAKGREVMRVLPRLNEDINEEWIDDKTRFACDGLSKNRLDRPYIREDGRMREASWDEALTFVAAKLKAADPKRTAAFAGDLCAAEEMVALKDLMTGFGVTNLECRVDGGVFDVSDRSHYIFNSTIAGLDQADAILLVGVNPRREAAILNARIRRNWFERRVKVGVVGYADELTYPYRHLGNGPQDIAEAAKDLFNGAQFPMIIIGAGAFARDDGAAVQALAAQAAQDTGCITDEWNGFNVLHNAASRVGALDIGFVAPQGFDIAHMNFVYLLNTDAPLIDMIPRDAFVVYQGHHGDAGARRADVIFPACAYTEKHGLYMNTEGRVQMGKKAVDAPGDAREDWKIIRALSERCNKTLRYDDLFQLRERIEREWPHFGMIDEIVIGGWSAVPAQGSASAEPFGQTIDDFYATNVIAKNSPTMQKCSALFVRGEDFQPVPEAAE